MGYKYVSFEDLTTPLGQADVEANLYALMERVGIKVTSWQSGAVARTLVRIFSVYTAGFSQLVAKLGKSLFLDEATGGWLDLVGYYAFNLRRNAQTFAAGSVLLTNSGGGIYDKAVGDLIVANPATGKAYRNTEAFLLGASSSASVAVEAIEGGSASSSGAGTITEIQTTMLGVTCSNPASIVGTDDELDEEYRARIVAKRSSQSVAGPRSAYTYWATSDGLATRVRVIESSGAVQVVVCNASGQLDVPSLATVYQTLHDHCVPLGVTCSVVNATIQTVPIIYAVWATSGLSEMELATKIESALEAFFAAQPIGGRDIGSGTGYVFADAILSAIMAADSRIKHATLSSPSSSVAIGATSILALGAIDATVTVLTV